jgi:hypothetical protein
MVNNAVPNFAGTADPNVPIEDLDTLFDFQLTVKPPQKLIPTSMYIAKITWEEKTGADVLQKLEKLGIVHQGPPYVSTNKIESNFANKLAKLPQHSQKRLVSLLFDWEEEVRRWAVLEDEEKEVKTIIEETKQVGGDAGHYEKRLLEIEGLKRLKPSMRQARPAAHAEQAPPAYQEAGPA